MAACERARTNNADSQAVCVCVSASRAVNLEHGAYLRKKTGSFLCRNCSFLIVITLVFTPNSSIGSAYALDIL